MLLAILSISEKNVESASFEALFSAFGAYLWLFLSFHFVVDCCIFIIIFFFQREMPFLQLAKRNWPAGCNAITAWYLKSESNVPENKADFQKHAAHAIGLKK
jgi:hypothetical protein